MPTTNDLWRLVWEALAKHGLCDEWGSAEETRVTGEWIARGRPVGIAEFIIAHTNNEEG